MSIRTLLALSVGGFVVLAGVAGLVVTRGELVEDDGEPTTYLVSGRASVPAGQIHDDVFLLRGTATVAGTVEDDVIVVSGRARIDGTVHGDVVVIRGDAVVTRDAEIGGDLRTSSPARVAGAATVGGDVTTAGPLDVLSSVSGLLWLGLWLAAGLSVGVLAVLAPRVVEDGARQGLRRPGRSFLLGILGLAAAPVVLAVLALSLVGGVLAVLLAAGLLVAAWFGVTASAGSLGRLLLPRGGRPALLAGTALLGLATGLALLVSPVLAALVAGAVVAHGLGALVPDRAPTAGSDPDPEPDELTFDDLLDAPPAPAADSAPADDEPRVLAAFPLSRN